VRGFIDLPHCGRCSGTRPVTADDCTTCGTPQRACG
jgi:hypothetical protein